MPRPKYRRYFVAIPKFEQRPRIPTRATDQSSVAAFRFFADLQPSVDDRVDYPGG